MCGVSMRQEYKEKGDAESCLVAMLPVEHV